MRLVLGKEPELDAHLAGRGNQQRIVCRRLCALSFRIDCTGVPVHDILMKCVFGINARINGARKACLRSFRFP